MNSSNTINFPSPNFSGHEFSNQVSNRTLVRGVPKGETLLAERSATAVNADGIREEVKVSAADNEIVKKTSEAGFTKCMRKLGVNPHQHPEKVDATSNAVELTTPGSKRSAEIVPRSLCMKNEKSDLNASGLSFLPKKEEEKVEVVVHKAVQLQPATEPSVKKTCWGKLRNLFTCHFG